MSERTRLVGYYREMADRCFDRASEYMSRQQCPTVLANESAFELAMINAFRYLELAFMAEGRY